jgi:hypothetical protein
MTAEAPGRRGARRTLALIAVVVAAPIVLSYAVYYLFPRGSFTNYGELLPTVAAPAIAGTRFDDGAPFRLLDRSGRWTMLVAAPGACDDACARRLYATRQARTMQGKDMARVERVWLVTGGVAPAPAILAEHPDIVAVRVDPGEAARLPRGPDAIHLVDPLGHQVLAWPADPDIKALARDISRLLKASRIG